MLKKNESNCTIRTVGIYAGKAYLDTNKGITSHYFINTKNPEKFIEIVNSIDWKHNNTVGPRSISKPELVQKIDSILNKS